MRIAARERVRRNERIRSTSSTDAETDRGIPIFTIIPEDAKTRGVDGVRDYVDAHPTDFVDMAQSTNAAVDNYSFVQDFLSSLATGAIDPTSSRYRIESVAQTFGVPPATIDGCYTTNTTQADINNCVQQSIDSVTFQTNFSAPTQAQFLGGVVGAAEPLAYAPYIASLLTVWKLFVHTGHLEYEYLPTTITLAGPSTARPDELLMGLKVPTIRPPGAYSDVLFFTIGDPQASEHAPAVLDDAPATGNCERTNRFSVPLHLDHTSRYVHDTALYVAPDGHAPYTIPLDPRLLGAPLVDHQRFTGSVDGAYTVSLRGRFGFDPIVQPAQMSTRVAFPSGSAWTIVAAPHREPVAGGTLDLVAASAGAACLSHAELQTGSSPPIDLTATHTDDQHVVLHAALTNVPVGPAVIRLYEGDSGDGHPIEVSYPLAIQAPPPSVDSKAVATIALGDRFVSLAGSSFEHVRGVLVNGVAYSKEPGATAESACFDGPPLDATITVGQHIIGQLVPLDGSTGEVFPVSVAPSRPSLANASIVGSATSTHLSTDPLTVTLQTGGAALPRQTGVRIRQSDAPSLTPCESLLADPTTTTTIAASSVHVRAPDRLAVDLRADVLQDRAFGNLQLQIVDLATGLGSTWTKLPGSFVRAPAVTTIACPPDASAPCRLYGSGLASIDAVANAAGTYVPVDPNCPPTDKGVACVVVPHALHFTVRLVDGGTIEPLPDALIANAKG